jgi:hypothetical protein
MLVISLIFAASFAPVDLVGITFDVTKKPWTKAVYSVNTATGNETQLAEYPSTFETLQSSFDAKNGVLYLADILSGELNVFNVSSSTFGSQAVQVDGDECDGNGFCFFDFGWDSSTGTIIGVGVGFKQTEVCLVSINPATGKVGMLHKMKSPLFQSCGFLQESGTFDPVKRVYYGVFNCLVNQTSVDLTTSINIGTAEEHILLQTNPRITPFPSTFARGVGLISHANGSLVQIGESGSISVIATDLGGTPERHAQISCTSSPAAPTYYAIIVNGMKKMLLAVDLVRKTKTLLPLSKDTSVAELACL